MRRDQDVDETHQSNATAGQMIMEKTPSGEVHSRGFDLQPVIAQDEGLSNGNFQLGRDVFRGVRLVYSPTSIIYIIRLSGLFSLVPFYHEY